MKPITPKQRAEALRLLAKGFTASEVAAKTGISQSKVYLFKNEGRHGAPAPRPLRVVPDAPPPADEAPPPPVPEPPPGLSALEADLWIIEHEIKQTQQALARARIYEPWFSRIPSLQKQLDDWMERRRELRPPPPPDAGEEERRWRQEADAVVRKIEAGVVRVERGEEATT